MRRFTRLVASLAAVIGTAGGIALLSPGAAVAGGCYTSSHFVDFGGYNKATLSARLCFNGTDASIGNVKQTCQALDLYISRCNGSRYAIYGNYSIRSATVYGTFYGSGPDNSYEGVIRITIRPSGASSWGWYYIYEV